jgi:hypothetical protein
MTLDDMIDPQAIIEDILNLILAVEDVIDPQRDP